MRKIVLTFALLFSPVLFAQTVDEIVQKSIEADGGLAALKSKTSIRMTGTFDMQGMTLPVTIIRKRPNLQRTEVSVQDGSVIDAFDGVTRWKVNPFIGVSEPTKATPEETAESLSEDYDGPLVDYKEKGNKIELLGKDTVDGQEAYKLKIVSANGREQEMYIDTTTYHPVRVVRKAETEQGEQVIDVRSSDFRTIDGVAVPYSITMLIGPMELKMTIDKVEFNIDAPDSLFKMPAPPAPEPTPTPAQPPQPTPTPTQPTPPAAQ
jgi:outer membrane lipoprotein-sorting protein